MAADRCSELGRREGLDPVGSAGCYHGFLLVEWPLPWPRDAAEVPALALVVAALREATSAGRPCRLQLVVDDTRPSGGPLRVIHYRRPRLAFSRFERDEIEVDRADVADACLQLLAREEDEPTANAAIPTVEDVLVCTHGSRDVCCAARGTALVGGLRGRLGTETKLWRTSHTGGHRFAPTAITLPDGFWWGYLTADTLAAIVARRGEAATVAGHCRGSSRFAHPAVQAVEREVLVREGWQWLAFRSGAEWVEAGASQPRRLEVLLHFERPDGSAGAYRSTVSEGRTVTVPPCREGAGGPTRDVQYVVERLERCR